jgi:peptidoglycan-associated lipoprotein
MINHKENQMRSIKSFALIASSAVLLAACSSPVKLDDNVKVEERQATEVGQADKNTRSVETVTTASVDPLTVGALAKRSIYFDYDSYIVKDEFKPTVEAHAKFLAPNKTRKIVIQGNTDDRGGREYNLALGQKRAEAVRKSLSLLGVPESQMEAISLGKEKPKALGSDEASWAENRRSDIIYQ